MELENIKDKIRKLLALHKDNTSDAESYAALQKAQELMVRYKIEQSDISEEQKDQKCIQKKTTLSYGTKSSDHYLEDLASIIADNFCCVNYTTTRRGSRTHYITFMGMEDDVEVACEVLYVANRYIVQGYNKVYKDMQKEYELDYIPTKYFNPAKKGYIKGYLAGLKEALESQKEKHQEWGLVLVVPQEAQDFIGGLEGHNFCAGAFNRVDTTYYDKGYEDGTNFHLNDKIEGTSPRVKITD